MDSSSASINPSTDARDDKTIESSSSSFSFPRLLTNPYTWLVILTCVAAFLIIRGGVRLPTFADEVRTWRDGVKTPYLKILTWRNNPDHVPLSYLLVKITCNLFGTDANWALRLP